MARVLLLLQGALGLLAPTRHLSRAPALHATNADWRSKCDSDGVVSYYDYGLRVGGTAAPAAAAPAADGFEVTMSGLKFKDEVRFSFPLDAIDARAQRRSSARARAPRRETSSRSSIPAGSPRVTSSSILVEIATCPSPSRSATAT